MNVMENTNIDQQDAVITGEPFIEEKVLNNVVTLPEKCPGVPFDDMQFQEPFTLDFAIKLLETLPEQKSLVEPLQCPKPGEWYMFSYAHNPSNKSGWQFDGFNWHNTIIKKIEHDDRQLHKYYSSQQHSADQDAPCFSRIVWEMIGPADTCTPRVLIQYVDRSVLSQDDQATLNSEVVLPKPRVPNKRKLSPHSHNNPKKVKGMTDSAGSAVNGCSKRKIFSPLPQSHAFRMLLTQSVSAACTSVPLIMSPSGFWYVYSYGNNLSLAHQWQKDGYDWQLQDSQTLTVQGGYMVKRHDVRLLKGVPINFHRYSYEFLPPDSAESLQPKNDVESCTSMKADTCAERDESFNSNEGKQRKTLLKRRNSWKWSPANSTKNKKKASLIIEEKRREASVEAEEAGSSLPLHCVLIHYLGKEEPELSEEHQQSTPVCRTVPLFCSEGSLRTSNIGDIRGIHRPLSASEAYGLLTETPSEQCYQHPPYDTPQAGLWYVLEYPGGASEACTHWSIDNFSWECLRQSKHITQTGNLLHKHYRQILNGELVHLYRSAYTLESYWHSSGPAFIQPLRVLLHYVGLDAEQLTESQSTEDSEGFTNSYSWSEGEERHSCAATVSVLSRDGLSIMVVTKQLQSIGLNTMLQILEGTSEEDCLTFAPYPPRCGQWYVFSYLALHPCQHNAWRKDSYKWRHSGTCKRPLGDGEKVLIIKYYKKVINNKIVNFVRQTCEIVNQHNERLIKRILIQYVGEGEDQTSLNFYSRNSPPVCVRVSDTEENKSYTIKCYKFIPDVDFSPKSLNKTNSESVNQTDSAVRKAISSILNHESQSSLDKGSKTHLVRASSNGAEELSVSPIQSGFDSSNNFYYEEVVQTSSKEGLASSHKSLQEISLRYFEDESDTSVDNGMPYAYRISKDIVVSLHEFQLKIKDTHNIFLQLIPSTICIISCKSNMNELRSLGADPKARHIAYYDRVWRTGGLYVTSLYSRHDHCERENLFPIAIVVHELDDLATHEIVLEKLLSYCSYLNSPELLLVTDAAPCVLDACKLVIPETKLAASWVNIGASVRMWFSKHSNREEEFERTLASVKKLLETATMGEFNIYYEDIASEWSLDFRGYFEEYLADVVYGSNTGNLLALSMFCKDGMSTEGCREFLMQMDYLFGESDVAYIDALAHLAYYMLYYYHNEIQKGRVTSTGVLFKRKPSMFKGTKRKVGFFPSWCAVPGDVAGAILHKMRVGQSAGEPPHFLEMDENRAEEEYKELINIEVELDENFIEACAPDNNEEAESIRFMGVDDKSIEVDSKFGMVNGDNVVEEITISVTEADADLSNLETFIVTETELSPPGQSQRKTSHKKTMSPNIKSHKLQCSCDDDIKPRTFLNPKSTVKKPKKSRRTVESGCKLFRSGRVRYDSVSNSYTLTGDGEEVTVQLSPVKSCSHCHNSKTYSCEHVVAAQLESMCGENSGKPIKTEVS